MADSFESLVNQALQDRIVEAAKADTGFIDSFLVSPRETYRNRFEEELFPGEEIEVIDRLDGSIALVLTRFGKGMILSRDTVIGGDELTDAELQLVSAGILCCVGDKQTPCGPQYVPGVTF
jgi:hypothetical protein